MGIKLKTEEGAEFSFDTVAEFMEFKKQMDEEEASKETESAVEEDASADEVEIPENEAEIKVGDKVRIVSSDDGTDMPYHYHDVGSVGKVVSTQKFGRIEVEVDCETQYLLPHHYEKVESLGKDANGEDLYVGDFVTGTEDNDYAYTNDKFVMEVLGVGESPLFDEANISVRIVGDLASYAVDSTRFVKLSDNLDEAKEKFEVINGEEEDELLPVGTKVRMLRHSNCGDLRTGDVGTITNKDAGCSMGLVYSVRVSSGEAGYGWARREDVEVVEDEPEFKVGDKVKVIGNSAGHCVEVGEVRRITEVGSEEPKYNLSDLRFGQWADTSDIELVDSSQKFRTGDIVRVTESFTDHFGGLARQGAVYSYDENLGFAEPFVGTVFLGDNIDKLVLVCRDEDRLDI